MAVSSGKGYMDKYIDVALTDFGEYMDYVRNRTFEINMIPVERFNDNGSI